MPVKRMPTHILHEASQRYGLTAPDLKLLARSDSGARVYQYQAGHHEFILKLIPHSHADKTLVKNSLESEVDWTTYLADQGVNTPRAILSQQGRYVEFIDLDDHTFFSAVSWHKASGRPLTQRDFGADLFTKLGRLSGQLHALNKQYRPGSNVSKRADWDEDEYLALDRLLPANDGLLLEKSWELLNRLQTLPRHPQSYGLVHGDFQEHNLHLSDGEIIVLDFENCMYCWYIFDFVAALEAVIGKLPFGPDMEALTLSFAEHYWQGYHPEHRLERVDFQRIPELFKLWELLLYSQFVNEWEMSRLSEPRRRLLANYRADIISGVRLSRLDFERFYQS